MRLAPTEWYAAYADGHVEKLGEGQMPEKDKDKDDKPTASETRAARRAWHKLLEESTAWPAVTDGVDLDIRGDVITADLTGQAAQRIGLAAYDVLSGQGFTVQFSTNPLFIQIADA